MSDNSPLHVRVCRLNASNGVTLRPQMAHSAAACYAASSSPASPPSSFPSSFCGLFGDMAYIRASIAAYFFVATFSSRISVNIDCASACSLIVLSCFYLLKLSTRLTICANALCTFDKLRSSKTFAEFRIESLDVASLKFMLAETSLTYLTSSACLIISATVGSKFSNSRSSWKLMDSPPSLLIS